MTVGSADHWHGASRYSPHEPRGLARTELQNVPVRGEHGRHSRSRNDRHVSWKDTSDSDTERDRRSNRGRGSDWEREREREPERDIESIRQVYNRSRQWLFPHLVQSTQFVNLSIQLGTCHSQKFKAKT